MIKMETEIGIIVMLIGLYAMYSWVHFTVIAFKKLQGLTKYEKVVSWVAFVTLALFVISILAE